MSKTSRSEAESYDDDDYTEGSKSDVSDDDDEEEWTNDHLKLLYLISRYAECASSPDEREGWIRKTPSWC